jgi:cell wall-associated NlpC family hydrolase
VRDVYLPALQLQGNNPLPAVRRASPTAEEPLSPASTMSSAIGRAAVAPVLAAPAVRSEQVSQLVLGETASILEQSGEWRRVSTHSDGYDGWIHAGYLLEVDDSATDEWRSRATGWSEGSVVSVEGRKVPLPLRARVILEGSSIRLPNGHNGQIAAGSILPLNEVQAAARDISPERWALQHFEGSPYLWGGVTPWGVDCSGLVQTTFAARRVQLPRDSAQQAGCGVTIDRDAIQPGDLLFFKGESTDRITHVAFAGEGDTLIHSTLSCGGALVESWLPGNRAASLRERLVAVRRLEQR